MSRGGQCQWRETGLIELNLEFVIARPSDKKETSRNLFKTHHFPRFDLALEPTTFETVYISSISRACLVLLTQCKTFLQLRGR
jgi:hypothetical protein